MKDTNVINGITYTEKDGIYYPDLSLPEQTNYPIGKYGQIRLDFLKKHRRGTYASLLVGLPFSLSFFSLYILHRNF